MSLVLENVTYIYGEGGLEETKALHDVSLTVPDHSFVGLVGHTGSGKSTLVQLMNGLLRPSQGRVLVDGYDLADKSKEVRERRKQVGLVFQYPEYQLFEETLPRTSRLVPKTRASARTNRSSASRKRWRLVDLDYDTWKDRSPFELSGGQNAASPSLALSPCVRATSSSTSRQPGSIPSGATASSKRSTGSTKRAI